MILTFKRLREKTVYDEPSLWNKSDREDDEPIHKNESLASLSQNDWRMIRISTTTHERGNEPIHQNMSDFSALIGNNRGRTVWDEAIH